MMKTGFDETRHSQRLAAISSTSKACGGPRLKFHIYVVTN
jgi:hypothetical protein